MPTLSYDNLQDWLKPYFGRKTMMNGIQGVAIKQITPIPFLIAKENNLIKTSRYIVAGVCQHCSISITKPWRFFNKRKYLTEYCMCKTCSLKAVTNLPEWKDKNSKSQLISQNKPEVKLKMSESVKKSKTEEVLRKHSVASNKNWSSDEYRTKHRNSMKNAFLNMSQESFNKMISKNRFYSGYYSSKFGRLFFNSSWELAYIVWCENNPEIISVSRCHDRIPYIFNGIEKVYNPDFLIDTTIGKYVIEIKGGYDYNIVSSKIESARKFYNDKCYCILFKKDLVRMKVFSQNFKPKEFIKSLGNFIELTSKEQHED